MRRASGQELLTSNSSMKVKQFIRELDKLNPEALVMVQTIDDNGDVQMVEADVSIDVRSGDAEVVPTE